MYTILNHTNLSTKSAFLPLVGAVLHCSQRFNAGMVSVVGLRPPRLAPGMSFSEKDVAIASSIRG